MLYIVATIRLVLDRCHPFIPMPSLVVVFFVINNCILTLLRTLRMVLLL